jgi:hypothetical protein
MPERQVRRIVIGTDQAARRAGGRGCEGRKRTLQIGKVGRLGTELEFDLRRDIRPPLLRLNPDLAVKSEMLRCINLALVF